MSDVLLVPSLARENVSHSWYRSGRNVPAEAKSLKYNRSKIPNLSEVNIHNMNTYPVFYLKNTDNKLYKL